MARWKGVALTLVGVVATVWLALDGGLGLYIHPRYFGFTAAMAVLGGAAAIVALALAPRPGEADDPDAAHGSGGPADAPSARRRGAVLGAWGAVLLVATAVVALLAVPPAALTSRTAVQRDIDRTTADLAGDAPSLRGADPASFTLKDWALLLRQNDDPSVFAGQEPELVGFVTPAPGDPDDAFYLARFTITCCAVDAQPIGVPVHLPGWRERFAVDDWVRVSGAFGQDPAGGTGLVLLPAELDQVEQPEQPYVY
ncbi:TIGR03943 family protein [Agromyces mediolanus]|uniref:TIGR03943 family putative permease subunit n=1 Tax=Agromyces mediolanus TaxID=41986 RepID=UPI003834AC6B